MLRNLKAEPTWYQLFVQGCVGLCNWLLVGDVCSSLDIEKKKIILTLFCFGFFLLSRRLLSEFFMMFLKSSCREGL